MEKRYDVVALGELLIDFTQNGMSSQGNPLFEANPGGAPCNVLSMLNNLGRKTAFIGKVGNDQFGLTLKSTLEELGIGTENLLLDPKVHTTLALVHTLADGDRDFSFYREPGADMMLKAREVREDLIASAKIFHFGTLSMTHPEVREATKAALEMAKKAGCLISFDPNLREPLWDSLDTAAQQVRYGLQYCDVLKISDNEIRWFTEEEDFDAGVRKLRQIRDIPLILVSMGKEGSRAYYRDLVVEQPPFLRSDTVDTTGAGDCFCANVLDGVLSCGLEDLTQGTLQNMLRRANAAASIVTTRKGALRVMPTAAEIEKVLSSDEIP